MPCRQQTAVCWESLETRSDARKNENQGSTDDPRKRDVERPKGRGPTAAPSRSASSPPGRGNPAAQNSERREGEPDCRKAVPRGDAEQLESAHATSVTGQGGDELPRRTSSGAQATLVPEFRRGNASSMSSHGRAWRIRIGSTETKRQRWNLAGADFFFSRVFRGGAWWGKKPVYLCPPIGPWS